MSYNDVSGTFPMGISASTGALLVGARRKGARFGDVLSIGRQSLTVPIAELKSMATQCSVEVADWDQFVSDGYADSFFRVILNADSVTSIDYSDYQKSDMTHDLNTPIPPDLKRQFDTVIDGGSLEHIFDIKQALSNYMDMVKLGGRLFISTTANNLCGHGFYQFSPELFYRVFGNANGFVVNDLVLIETPLLSVEASRHQRFFRVADPATVGGRIRLLNSKPVSIFLDATRVTDEAPFHELPLQSDYGPKWQRGKSPSSGNGTEHRPFEYVTLWEEFRRRLQQRRRKGLANRRFFQPFDPTSG